jgi:hypothetical protein
MKITKYIKQKLINAWVFSRSPNHMTYEGKYGLYVGESEDEITFKIYFRKWNIDYHGGKGDLIGEMGIN